MTPRPDHRTPGLALGNVAQQQRRALRRALAAGDVDLPALIEGGEPEHEPTALRMSVAELLGPDPAVSRLVLVCTAGDLEHANVQLRDIPINRRVAIAAALREDVTT